MRAGFLPHAVLAACAFATSIFGGLQGCAEITGDANHIRSITQAYDTGMDLISPATCTLRNGRLAACTIPTSTLQGLELETAVPLRTVLTTRKTGNCSTPFSLEVTLETPGEPDVRFPFFQLGTIAVRRRDGEPIATLTVRDSSPWTKHAAFDASCQVHLDVISNEPDVDSKAEAEAIVAQLEQDLVAKSTTRDHYEALTLYNGAFDFLRTVAESMHTELTSDNLQHLRASALDSVDTLARLLSTCNGSSEQDQANLLFLIASLPALGSADSWQNADGSAKTLADVMGPRAAGILETIERLAQQREVDGGSQYDVAYQEAAAAVVRAEAKLARARTQLGGWLNP